MVLAQFVHTSALGLPGFSTTRSNRTTNLFTVSMEYLPVKGHDVFGTVKPVYLDKSTHILKPTFHVCVEGVGLVGMGGEVPFKRFF